jgi:hypothetical protein
MRARDMDPATLDALADEAAREARFWSKIQEDAGGRTVAIRAVWNRIARQHRRRACLARIDRDRRGRA